MTDHARSRRGVCDNLLRGVIEANYVAVGNLKCYALYQLDTKMLTFLI